MEQVDLATGKNRTPDGLAKNPRAAWPFVELDDGTTPRRVGRHLPLLEGMHPEPNLMGKDSREQAFIEMWNRRVELNLFGAAARAFQHTSDMSRPASNNFRNMVRRRKRPWRISSNGWTRKSAQAVHRGRSVHDRGYHAWLQSISASSVRERRDGFLRSRTSRDGISPVSSRPSAKA